MTDNFEPIRPEPFAAIAETAVADPGPAPMLQWIPVADLVIDRRYQREIGKAGRGNVARIIAAFRWTRFAPVVVAPVEGGGYAVVDGQHRATAAAALGHARVPCMVILADMQEQADAFAAINSIVTAMTPAQIHAAKLASGDPVATELVRVCRSAGVEICRYPIPANKMRVGETLAAAALTVLFKRYGEPTLALALKCITKTRDGNPGLVRAPIVKALCAVIDAEPAYLSREAEMLRVMASFQFSGQLDIATFRAKKQKSNVATALAAAIYAHLDDNMKMAA